ncbi:MAG TPA: hypothetical protein VM681_09930, partial [Candidatus Thermoplasmatota archaeon]|nr:hypothetical protein [Candidatus Thermoplasmatota archaeon]
QPLRVAARVPPFFKAGLRAGQVVHVGVGWQLVPARVAQPMGAPAGHEGTIEVVPDGSVVHDASDRVALWSLDATGLRLAASGRVA